MIADTDIVWLIILFPRNVTLYLNVSKLQARRILECLRNAQAVAYPGFFPKGSDL